MNFSNLHRKTQRVVSDNAASILTGIGVVGTVATGVLTAKASFKAAAIIREREAILHAGAEKARAIAAPILWSLVSRPSAAS